jgi:ADP-ribose pyrophosphatase YjhB (NUDIX family)
MKREYPESPIVTVGLFVRRGDSVLIVQRGKEPAKGRWSIPGGAVELGESLREAGRREVREECGVEVTVGDVACVLETIVPGDSAREGGRPRFHYVLIDFHAEYVSGELRPASDISDARWVTRSELAQFDITEKAREMLEKILG